MNLQQWIADDHASLLTRFDNAIAAHVPIDQWKTSGFSAAPSPSIAWLVLHGTYHQDLALNTAVRNHVPLIGDHREALGIASLPPSTGLTESEDRDVTEVLDLGALRAYVEAVASGAQAWIDMLSIMALDSIPNSSYRLEHLAGIPADGELSWLHAMWTGKTVAWFVQWECIGHGHAHLGEMIGIRNRLGHSPH